MSIWDVIDAALDATGAQEKGLPVNNSTYGCNIGDYLWFTIGNGYQSNVFGSNTQVVMDWEVFLEKLFGLAPFPAASLLTGGILGATGNNCLVFGNNTSFGYYGDSFTVDRRQRRCEIKQPTIPIAVAVTLGVGALGLLSAALVLRFKYGIISDSQSGATDSQKTAVQIATLIIPPLESRWLFVLKLVEYLQLVLPLKQTIQAAENALTVLREKVAASEKETKECIELMTDCPENDIGIYEYCIELEVNRMETYSREFIVNTEAITQATAQLGEIWSK